MNPETNPITNEDTDTCKPPTASVDTNVDKINHHDPDVQIIINSWDTLPENIKTAIKAIVTPYIENEP